MPQKNFEAKKPPMIDIKVLYTFLISKGFVFFEVLIWKPPTREIFNNTTTIKKHLEIKFH